MFSANCSAHGLGGILTRTEQRQLWDVAVFSSRELLAPHFCQVEITTLNDLNDFSNITVTPLSPISEEMTCMLRVIVLRLNRFLDSANGLVILQCSLL